jgi:hypothetical protein
MGQIGRFLRFPVRLMGGWLPFLGLLVVIAAVLIGLFWERSNRPPVPPQASGVTSDINAGNLRQTSFRVPSTIEEVLAFYRQELPKAGWRYCGTQTTPGCSNMESAPRAEIDVYRRADDADNTGTTIEIWPLTSADGLTRVTLFETQPQ